MAKNNRLDDFIKQPQLAPSAAELGMEAYRANLADPVGYDPAPKDPPAGVQQQWNTPEAEIPPKAKQVRPAQEIQIGHDVKPD